MKRFVILSMFLIGGCQGEFVETITDPNTLEAAGQATQTVGLAIGMPEVIGAGIILGGIAIIIKALRS